MLALRILWFINKYITISFYKLCYGRNLMLPLSCKFRFGLNIVIDNKIAIVKIGENCFFNNFCSINSLCKIEIGNNVIMGENVKIYDHNHKYKEHNVVINNQGFTCKPIKIGNNCWIGSNVTILKGVTIGDNCVIGAGCVIYKEVPSNTLVINKQDIIYRNTE